MMLLMFIYIMGMGLMPFFLVRFFDKKQKFNSSNIEKKLDKIIELLEHEKKG